VDVVKVEQSQRAGVFEQHRKGVAAFEDLPRMQAVVAQTAVLGVDEIQLPQRHLTAGDGGTHVAPSHGREQGVHADPFVGWAAGQRLGDRLAASLGRGQDVTGALSLDLLYPAELVDHRMGQPALPQLANHLSRRIPQCGVTLRGQLEPSTLDLGQPTSLDQQRPGK
jgi:hypothetical protein